MRGSKELFEELQEKIAYEINMVEEGNLNYLDALIEMNQYKVKIEETLNDIKDWQRENIDEIQNEAQGYKGQYKGYKFEVRNGKTMYDFKGIEHIAQKEKELKDLKENHKQAYIQYQKGMLNVNTDGEEIELPKVSYSASYVILKKIKK